MEILELVVDADREDHIARHHVSVDEVYEVVENSTSFVRHARDKRYVIIGQTLAGRYLAVYVASRERAGIYGLVTARDADDKQRRAYQRYRGH